MAEPTVRQIDQQLVERAQRGDKKAFELLVLKYQRKLARLLSRFVRDPAEVEDVTQEAFIKAYRALPSFRGDSAFYTWLYRIGINTAKNYLVALGRRARRRQNSTRKRRKGSKTRIICATTRRRMRCCSRRKSATR
jgi:RNA polymerase sigma-70 factor (ECF subfamily)